MSDRYLNKEWYPEYQLLENKVFPSAPQTDDYKYYQVLFDGNNYWCWIKIRQNTKLVGLLSVDADGPEKAGILPFPCKAFDLKEKDEEILYQFLKINTWEPSDSDWEEASYCTDLY
jgi:hypothetical protein